MKKIVLLANFCFIFFIGKGQINMYGQIEDGYRNFMLNSHDQLNKVLLTDFIGAGGDNRFMSNYWLVGGATNNFNVTISGNYLFNYDFLGQELHAKWKDTNIVVNTSYLKRFFLLDKNITHNFVKSPVLDPQGKYFYESLGYNEENGDSGKVQLLKLRTIKTVKTNKNDYLANFSGDYADKLDNNIEYFIVLPDNTATKIKFNKKSLTAALSKYKQKCDEYFKHISELDEQTAGDLIRSINE